MVGLNLTPSVKSILTHTTHDAYSNPNLEMVDATKAVEIYWFFFSCYWTAMLCSKLFLQLSIWRLESVEDISLQHFQLHHLHGNFIC
jgi:hypothetical protein